MVSKLIFLLMTGALYHCASPQSSQSLQSEEIPPRYAQSALAMVVPAYETLLKNLPQVMTSKVLPHETKTIRKELLAVRELLDLFMFAYPEQVAGSIKKDPLLELRGSLDEGYEAIGEFKDLFDAQGLILEDIKDLDSIEYDQAKVDKRRKVLLKWHNDFLAADEVTFYRSYLSNPSSSSVFERAKIDLPRFLWGATEVRPNIHSPSQHIFRALMIQLLGSSVEVTKAVFSIKNLTKDLESEERFHDFRKQLRVALKLPSYFDNLPSFSDAQRESLATELSQLVENFGQINDLLVAYHLAEKEGENKRAEKLTQIIDKLWDDLRDDPRASETKKQLKTYKKYFVQS